MRGVGRTAEQCGPSGIVAESLRTEEMQCGLVGDVMLTNDYTVECSGGKRASDASDLVVLWAGM